LSLRACEIRLPRLKTLTVSMCRETAQTAWIKVDLPTCRSMMQDYQMLPKAMWSACSRFESQGIAAAWSTCDPTASRHHRAVRCIAGPYGEYSDLLRPQARHGAEYLHPMLEPILKETSAIIYRTGDADRQLMGYSLGKPTCCAARWARKSARNGKAARVRRAPEEQRTQGQRHHFECWRSSPITASTRARRGLCGVRITPPI